MSIWSRLRRLFGSTAVEAPAPEAPAPKRGTLLTDMERLPAQSGFVADFINRRLAQYAPRMLPAPGAAMDSFDLADATLTDIGEVGTSETLFAWFGLQTFVGHQMCAILAQHWLIDKACSLPARDAIRHGFDLIVSDQEENRQVEIKKAITVADRRFRLRKNMREYVREGRVFGIRVVIFKVETGDPKYYEYPFNPDAVTPGSYRGMAQVDPYWMTPQFDDESIRDPAAIHFYEPTWWVINGVKYHKSHLAIFRTAEPADLLKPTYQYGGIPVPQKIMERVYAAERTANEAPQLAMTKRLTVWNTDIAHVLANQEQFAIHMANFMRFRDNYGMKINDSDDKMEQFDTTLSGFDEMITTQYKIVAAAADVPEAKLMGVSPKGGLGANGNYEEASYHEELETIQEDDLTPLVDRHHLLVGRSVIEPAFKLAPGTLTIEHQWSPLDSPTAEELASTNLKKAQADQALANAGAIDGEDIRNRIRSEKDTGYTGIEAGAPEPEEEPEPDAKAA